MRAHLLSAAHASRASSGTPVGRRRWMRLLLPASVILALALSWAAYERQFALIPALAAQVRFEVRLAEDRPAPGLRVARTATDGPVLYVHPEVVVNNDDIAQAWVVEDAAPQFGVAIQLLPAGAERMRQASEGHVGRRVAILIDGTVVMAPVVRSPLGESAVITGLLTREEAARIAEGMMLR